MFIIILLHFRCQYIEGQVIFGTEQSVWQERRSTCKKFYYGGFG